MNETGGGTTTRATAIFALLGGLILILSVADLALGSVRIPFEGVIRALAGKRSEERRVG
jgi:hypothetical protein